MKANIFYLTILVVLFSSCSTAYKNSQTPDDVYYSPSEGNFYQEAETTNSEDNYLRMKVKNNNRWNSIDDYSYWNDSRFTFSSCYTNYNTWGSSWNSYYYNNWNNHFIINNNCGWNNSWYSWNYSTWSSWNSPYYYFIPYKNPTVSYGNTSGSNITAYKNKKYNNINSTYFNTKTGSSSTSSSSGFSGLVKRVFSSGNSGSSGSSSWDRPIRTYNSSGSSTSSGSSSAGGKSGGYESTGSSSSSSRSGRN
ncbi:MAG: hypothetical protein KF781_01425 [Chitinophagaceae bacterium]|nr:hypothetical protein [Chitinophagaceae bacterium]MCW5905395.1 hypothetical protein [Chitinophagaceae bacterium]